MTRPSGLPHLLVILASTRTARFGDTVARWLMPILEARSDSTAELADLRSWPFAYYDRAKPASLTTPEDYEEPIRSWSELVRKADGFVVITPEYNHGYPAVLKSALDALYAEWVRKPVAFVSYGGWSGGVRAVEQLRLVAIELQMAPVRGSVVLQFAPRLFDENGRMQNAEFFEASATRMLDDLVWWTLALKAARTAPANM
ncbi:MAG TPA: NAD(P)H-dependent oxidoreductase [Chloroflexota bacterium]|nr:NAD(P)H-dependent oxidoreductase [Chloroflexota bacterium]